MAIDEKTNGNSDIITKEYFDSLLVEMRHIDSVIPNTQFSLYGQQFKTPVMTAALSHIKPFSDNCRSGMMEIAQGALSAGAVMWIGMCDNEELELVTGTGAKTIKIIKPYADNNQIYSEIESAEKCGALAVGIDIDHSFNKAGQFDNVAGYPLSSKPLEEIKEIVKSTKLPFIIKGVLSIKDAEKCLEAGAKGIVISHHHGIMDYAVPPLMILPKIAELVNGEIPIFVDCDIVRGFDAFKALALGATAVSVGRALMPAHREKGSLGVTNKISEMTKELSGAMAHTGSPNIDHIDPAVIWRTK